jgi:acyl-CoA thioesterase
MTPGANVTALEPADVARRVAGEMMLRDLASALLGIRLEFVDDKQVTVSMAITERHLNGHGSCHGGLLFALADTAFALACNGSNQAAVAAAATIDFVSPGELGEVLNATATMRVQGKRLGVYDIEVTAADGRLVALFRGRSARLSRAVIEGLKP